MGRRGTRTRTGVLASTVLCIGVVVSGGAQSGTPASPAPDRVDYLTFARGALPVRIDGAGARLGSAFILSRAADGVIRGVRSDNGGPFRYYTVEVAPPGTALDCGTPSPPALGCDSIIHGITFDFDSAVIRPDSSAVLDDLYTGLAAETTRTIVIEGHTSSEGTDAYNRSLSERRAQAVVANLVARGIPNARISAAGLGDSRPIAANGDESGRSLNRRVEVKCR